MVLEKQHIRIFRYICKVDQNGNCHSHSDSKGRFIDANLLNTKLRNFC